MEGPSFDPAIGHRVRADRALERQIAKLGCDEGQMTCHLQEPYVTATFEGTRHRMTWAFDGISAVAAAEAMIALLPDHEFTIPGHLVATATVTAVDSTPLRLVADVELLLLKESQ